MAWFRSSELGLLRRAIGSPFLRSPRTIDSIDLGGNIEMSFYIVQSLALSHLCPSMFWFWKTRRSGPMHGCLLQCSYNCNTLDSSPFLMLMTHSLCEGKKLSFSCKCWGWIHCTSIYGITYNHIVLVCAGYEVYLWTIRAYQELI